MLSTVEGKVKLTQRPYPWDFSMQTEKHKQVCWGRGGCGGDWMEGQPAQAQGAEKCMCPQLKPGLQEQQLG